MTDDAPHRVVIAGGGVAALETMLALHDLAKDQVEVTLVCPDEDFVYRPLATGEPFGVSEVTTYSVSRLATDHGAKVLTGAVASVDPDARSVKTYDGDTQSYDSLVVALGASRDIVFEDALTFIDQRSISGFRELLDKLRAGSVHSIAFLVPRGVVWPFPLYELALMTGELARDADLDVELTLVTSASRPLALFGPEAAEAMTELLADRGVAVRAGNAPQVLGPGRVLLEPDGVVLAADRLVTIPRLTGPRLAGLPHDRDGFIHVDDHGRVPDVEDVYAAGDCANYPFKQGGLAAQQADIVAQTIAAGRGEAAEPEPFRPVLRGILLTGQGRRFLRRLEVDELGSHGQVAGNELWWPPTKIAGRRLAPALGALDHDALIEQAPEPGGVLVEVDLAGEQSGT
jgi:sulfide:quinone oxidoreductase